LAWGVLERYLRGGGAGLEIVKAAFAAWNQRIAPVFDVARNIHLVETEAGRIVSEGRETLAGQAPGQKALRLAELGVTTLVCGAISRPMHDMVAAYGIRVIPFVAGDLREIIQAWISDGLENDLFAMPGCCRRGRRRFRGMDAFDQEGFTMGGGNRGGMGRGGQGRGLRGRGVGMGGGSTAQGPMSGPVGAGAAGYCICPRCGHQELHTRGTPCMEKKCPNCGIAMTRQ